LIDKKLKKLNAGDRNALVQTVSTLQMIR